MSDDRIASLEDQADRLAEQVANLERLVANLRTDANELFRRYDEHAWRALMSGEDHL